MAGLFIESFDHIKSGPTSDPAVAEQLLSKWTSLAFSPAVIGAGRNGNGIRLNAGARLFKSLPHRSTWIIGFAYKVDAGTASGIGSNMYFGYHNSTQLVRLAINSDGTVSVFPGTSSSAIITSAAVHQGKWNYYELKYTISGTSNLNVNATLRINGEEVGSNNGNTGINVTSLTRGTATTNRHEFAASSSNNFLDDIYMFDNSGSFNNDFAGDVRISKVVPNGDVVSDWTPNAGSEHFSRVNEIGPDGDTSYVYSGTVNAQDIWDWQDIPSFNGTILGVQVLMYARKDNEGSKAFRIVVGDTGSEASSSNFYVHNDYEYYHTFFDTDPATGIQWSQSGFNAKRFGVKVQI